MGEQFLLPKDPRLDFGMLLPSSRRKHLRAPVEGSRTAYVFWARNAIYHALRALEIRPGENVLVPAYHCTSVVEPILRHGGTVKFYNVSRTLEANIAEIEKRIDTKTRSILAIHYFGFPQSIFEIKEICQKRKLSLIEDCAHVLVGQTKQGIPLGATGEVSIFSWRKFLPLYDGGQLVINKPELKLEAHWESGSALFNLKVAKNLLDKAMEDSSNRFVNWFGRLSHAPSALRRQFAAADSRRQGAKGMVSSYETDFDPASANLKMSRLSQYVMCHADIADISAKRRRNYIMLDEGIKPLSHIRPLHAILPDNVIPWVFPVLAVGARDLHLRLRERGVPATNWSGVIHPSLQLKEFPEAQFLYDNIVFLPVHQSLQKTEIETMLRILAEVPGKTVATDAQDFDGGVPLSALSGR